jgi:hypothetical protein
MHNLLTDGQAEPGARVGVGVMKSLEKTKYLFGVLGGDADSVVMNANSP